MTVFQNWKFIRRAVWTWKCKITQETLAWRSSLDYSGASVIIRFSHAAIFYYLLFQNTRQLSISTPKRNIHGS